MHSHHTVSFARLSIKPLSFTQSRTNNPLPTSTTFTFMQCIFFTRLFSSTLQTWPYHSRTSSLPDSFTHFLTLHKSLIPHSVNPPQIVPLQCIYSQLLSSSSITRANVGTSMLLSLVKLILILRRTGRKWLMG